MSESPFVAEFRMRFRSYRDTGALALEQVPDADLNWIPFTDANSVAMIVRHLSGNFASRFTDFLTSDGEKPWRDRDAEFADREYTRAEVMEMWDRGWAVVEQAVGGLTDADLARTVAIREQPLSVHSALMRAVAHAAYHVGQIVLLARMRAEHWKWISIPKGQSQEYNKAPTMEHGPGGAKGRG